MTPKGIGLVSYFLIISSIILLIITLLASQGMNLFHINDANAIEFQSQVALSLLNCFISFCSAYAILKGNILGRNIWQLWATLYLVINIWQLDNAYYLIPSALSLSFITLLLFAKPAQHFFDRNSKKKRSLTSRRVDSSYNIFDD